MPKIFLAPGSKENIQRSVKDGVSIEVINPVEPTLKSIIRVLDHPIRIWGVGDAIKDKWADVRAGDIILFYAKGSKRFTFKGDVAFTYPLDDSSEQLTEAKKISKSVWGSDEWFRLIFLSKTEEIDIPLSELNAITGYNIRGLKGFMKVTRNSEGIIKLLVIQYLRRQLLGI